MEPLQQCSESTKEETIEDIYAEMIVYAKVLTPLKSKEEPKVAASACIHPKKSLRGGGNASQSYIVCKDCHTRWECHARAKDLKLELKMEKEKRTMGPSSQMEVESMGYENSVFMPPMPKFPTPCSRWSPMMSEGAMMPTTPMEDPRTQEISRMELEMRAMRQEAREKELRQEAMIASDDPAAGGDFKNDGNESANGDTLQDIDGIRKHAAHTGSASEETAREGAMRMSRTSREATGEEGRTTPRSMVLQVHAAKAQLLFCGNQR